MWLSAAEGQAWEEAGASLEMDALHQPSQRGEQSCGLYPHHGIIWGKGRGEGGREGGREGISLHIHNHAPLENLFMNYAITD